jgi:UDP-N-acetylglucosamine 2-epimerase (non-hydrolysing)
MLITIVAGARPNFIKIAPIILCIQKAQLLNPQLKFRLVHTGQHYDKKMSGDFFTQLGIPEPDCNLACGGGTQAEQTASIMMKFESDLIKFPPDVVLVVGDVTSTMACTVTAKKLNIDVVHVESGIRSGDKSMPEEINRILTDSICDHHFTTTLTANANLLLTNVPIGNIHFVGNTMIDTLFNNISRIRKPDFWDTFNLNINQYYLLTLHRPSNVDNPDKFVKIFDSIIKSSDGVPIIFPVHPRTNNIIKANNIDTSNLILIDPQGYLEFIYLVKYSRGIITDSGGISEEATLLNIPCITLRNSTERPETVTQGTNILVGDDLFKLELCLNDINSGNWKKSSIPELWDGKSANRIVEKLQYIYT